MNAPHETPPILNKEEALERLGGDMELFKRAIGLFLDQMPGRCDALRSAFDRRDFGGLADLAHMLKSTAATVGAECLRAMFITLEGASRDGNPVIIEALIVQAEREFSRFRETASPFANN